MESGKFLRVKSKFIHPSSIIPPKSHDYSLYESVKTVGIQQPLIVRPLASKPGEYEIIDGLGRHEALDDPEKEVWVEVRQASDAEAFKISDATSKTTQRNTCDNAAFFSAYIQCVKEESGEKGALARVAAETKRSESELSQLSTINKLFLKLSLPGNEAEFPKLKAMGINKLYKLSELLENPGLLKAAREIEKKADKITLEGISAIVENLQPSEVGIPPEIMDFLYDEPAKAASADSVEESAATKRFRVLTEKIAAQVKETDSLVQSIEIEKLPATESTINILEKMSVCYRRFSYCANKLKEQKDGCPKTG